MLIRFEAEDEKCVDFRVSFKSRQIPRTEGVDDEVEFVSATDLENLTLGMEEGVGPLLEDSSDILGDEERSSERLRGTRGAIGGRLTLATP